MNSEKLFVVRAEYSPTCTRFFATYANNYYEAEEKIKALRPQAHHYTPACRIDEIIK